MIAPHCGAGRSDPVAEPTDRYRATDKNARVGEFVRPDGTRTDARRVEADRR
ncbi:hypothetical protein [Halovivax gelatinilyticus]|uniref:hypothetical protein n=1 Tax=Halovivax gelatinilyticus TaxID=2961597 RepID=UPI0020CA2BD4|nr:hypothetical protein [Halovivax gelatinilyticus]